MQKQALHALHEILRSTLFLLRHYQGRTEAISAVKDVEQAIQRAVRQIEEVLTEQAAD